MQKVGKLNDAEKYYSKAIDLKFDFAEPHNNMGTLYLKLNKIEEAEVSLCKAITFYPRYIQAIVALCNILEYKNQTKETKIFLQKIIELDPNNFGLRAGVHLAIINFLEDDFLVSKNLLLKSEKIHEKLDNEILYKNEKVYQDYLFKLLN